MALSINQSTETLLSCAICSNASIWSLSMEGWEGDGAAIASSVVPGSDPGVRLRCSCRRSSIRFFTSPPSIAFLTSSRTSADASAAGNICSVGTLADDCGCCSYRWRNSWDASHRQHAGHSHHHAGQLPCIFIVRHLLLDKLIKLSLSHGRGHAVRQQRRLFVRLFKSVFSSKGGIRRLWKWIIVLCH